MMTDLLNAVLTTDWWFWSRFMAAQMVIGQAAYWILKLFKVL